MRASMDNFLSENGKIYNSTDVEVSTETAKKIFKLINW